jgi:hypothetical protein
VLVEFIVKLVKRLPQLATGFNILLVCLPYFPIISQSRSTSKTLVLGWVILFS